MANGAEARVSVAEATTPEGAAAPPAALSMEALQKLMAWLSPAFPVGA